MEKFILRVLVLVLLGAAVGGVYMARSKVMLHLPDQGVRQTSTSRPAGTPDAPRQEANPSAVNPPVPVTSTPGGTSAVAPGSAVATTSVPAPAQPSTAEQYFISLERAKALHDAGDAIFIDARTFTEYTEGHIRGAMHCDKKYFDGAAPKKVLEYLPGKEVVVYCHGAECTDSEALVKRLIALHKDIGPYHIIKDGFPGWKDKSKADPVGYPIDIGGEVGFP